VNSRDESYSDTGSYWVEWTY